MTVRLTRVVTRASGEIEQVPGPHTVIHVLYNQNHDELDET